MTMPKNARFWRNVTLIGLAHVALITGLVRWSAGSKKRNSQSIVWINGGAGEGAGARANKMPPPKAAKISTPPPVSEFEAKNEAEEDLPVLTSVKSDIQLPAATPAPSPKPTSTLKPVPTPKVQVTPKPAQKPNRNRPRSLPLSQRLWRKL